MKQGKDIILEEVDLRLRINKMQTNFRYALFAHLFISICSLLIFVQFSVTLCALKSNNARKAQDIWIQGCLPLLKWMNMGSVFAITPPLIGLAGDTMRNRQLIRIYLLSGGLISMILLCFVYSLWKMEAFELIAMNSTFRIADMFLMQRSNKYYQNFERLSISYQTYRSLDGDDEIPNEAASILCPAKDK